MAGTDLISIIAQRYDEAPLHPVEVPEWGVTLYFRPLTAAERDRIRAGHGEKDDTGLLISAIITKALDADGNRVFEDDAKTRAILTAKADLDLLKSISRRASPDRVEGDVGNG